MKCRCYLNMRLSKQGAINTGGYDCPLHDIEEPKKGDLKKEAGMKNKNPYAVALGRAGGKAWAASRTKEERHEAALKAGKANAEQWKKIMAARRKVVLKEN